MSTLKVNNVQDLGADAVVTNGVVNAGALPAGSILQVANAVRATNFSTSSTTYVDVTDLSITMTPRDANSKFLITAHYTIGFNGNYEATVAVDRNGTTAHEVTSLNVYDAHTNDSNNFDGQSFSYLDSPATASAVTYKIQLKNNTAAAVLLGSRASGGALDNRPSHFTVMEVAG